MHCVLQLFLYDLETCHPHERAMKQYRQQELEWCFIQNLSDENIEKLHIFFESQKAMDHYMSISTRTGKCVPILFGRQPTYKDLMMYVRQTFLQDEIVCIMNADMFFRSVVDHKLIRKHLGKQMLFALTRHEITDLGHTIHGEETCPFTVHGGSADVFLFRAPVSAEFDVDLVDHRQNVFGGENVFCYAWHKAGYQILNPCDDIITLHMHRNRHHFQQYPTIGTEETRFLNLKTPLP